MMEVKSELGGELISINDTIKNRGILLSREAVRDIVENEEFYSSKLLKMMRNRHGEEEIMRELPDGVVLRIGLFKEQLRADIRETTLKDGTITFMKSGVNLSVFHFLQVMRKMKEISGGTISAGGMVAEDEGENSDPPPAKKPKQTLSKQHHPKDGKGAKSFRKGVKAIKKKSTVVSSDEESN